MLRERADDTPSSLFAFDNECTRAEVWSNLSNVRPICDGDARALPNRFLQPMIIAHKSQRLPEPRISPVCQRLQDSAWLEPRSGWRRGRDHRVSALAILSRRADLSGQLKRHFSRCTPPSDPTSRGPPHCCRCVDIHHCPFSVQQAILRDVKSPVPNFMPLICEVTQTLVQPSRRHKLS